MKLALYKTNRPGIAKIFNILVRFWLAGKYSHCELIFSDGTSASSSFLDGGIRFKTIDFKLDHWDIFEIGGDENTARSWFERHINDKYDVLGLIGFIFRPIKGFKTKWVCSEAIMEALGYKESWRIDPCMMAMLSKLLK